MKRSGKLYRQISEWDNLLIAFYNAARGKRLKPDVVLYEKNLYENLKTLQTHLINQTVPIGNYRFFKIYDPKERLICAAPFEERVLHHAIINITGLVFERLQIYDSYACRKGKGTNAALSGECSVRGETEPAKCVEVRVFCCRACAYPPRRAGVLNRI